VRLESPDFTTEDLDRFVDELVDRERKVLVQRLEAASTRLLALASKVPEDAVEPGSGSWNAIEVLAHIAVLSKFYGVLTYQIGTGRLTELRLLENVHLRDVVGSEMAKTEPAELATIARLEHEKTLAWLRRATAAELRRECVADGRWRFTAEEMARTPLICHLELHLDQLAEALA
jgi:uncharacterized damage-inducible protein DinB